MRVSIVTTGRFHVLDLGRELAALGCDVGFFSCVPRERALRFGLPAGVHRRGLLAIAPLLLAQRRCGPGLARIVENLTILMVDRAASSLVGNCDVFIGMSGLCRRSIQRAKERYGALTVLERGSRHILSQKRILEAIPGAARPAVTRFALEREMWGYAHADVIDVPSHHVLQSFVDEGVAADRLFRNPYGVDLEMFPPTVRRRIPNQRPTLVFTGTWSLRKGCDVLGALAEANDWRILHAGPVGDAPLPERGHFETRGVLPQRELPAVYAEGDVFVHASREEGLSLVQAQALACGLPLVCTERTGGQDLRECLDDPRWVTVVPVDDREALANGVRHALAMAGMQSGPREILGNARQRLSWRAYGMRMVAELDRRLALRGDPVRR